MIMIMDTNKRTWVKAMTWQLLGLIVMTTINVWYLDTWLDSLGLALLLAATGMVMFYIHERLWRRIGWGLSTAHHAVTTQDDTQSVRTGSAARDSRIAKPHSGG